MHFSSSSAFAPASFTIRSICDITRTSATTSNSSTTKIQHSSNHYYQYHDQLHSKKCSQPPRRRPRPGPSPSTSITSSQFIFMAARSSSSPRNNNYNNNNSKSNSSSFSNHGSNDFFKNNTENTQSSSSSSSSSSSPSPSSSPAPLIGDDSYIQCPKCSAVYEVDADELDTSPRVMACSACLHEWYACEDSLMWGDDVALKALVSSKKSSLPSYVKATLKTSISDPENDDRNQTTSDSTNLESEQRRRDEMASSTINDIRNNYSATGKRNVNIEHESKDDGFSNAEIEDDEHEGDEREQAYNNINSNPIKSINNNRNKSKYDQREAYSRSYKSYNPRRTWASATSRQPPPRRYEVNTNPSNNNGSIIFVGNLSYRASEDDLYHAFAGYGSVEKCQVAIGTNGSSKGFGFVKMGSAEECAKAINALQGASLLGRDVSLSEARRDVIVDFHASQRNQVNSDYRSPSHSPPRRYRRSSSSSNVPWHERERNDKSGSSSSRKRSS